MKDNSLRFRPPVNAPAKRSFFLLFFIVLTVLATSANGAFFTVTKTADTNDGSCDSDCSLREAIEAANSAAGDDDINFDRSVFSTTRTITLGGTQLSIAGGTSLRINGPGSNLLTISGNNASRAFLINENAVAVISGVNITQGMADGASGGGIINKGTLTLKNSSVQSSTAMSGFGGGIHNDGGILDIESCAVLNNSSGTGGGIYSSLGAISPETLNITNSTISGNRAFTSFGGGIVVSGTMSMTGSQINGNRAATNGGGIYFTESPLPKTIQNTSITSNLVSLDGGGIYNFRSKLTFEDSTMNENSAVRAGAGYYQTGTLESVFTNAAIDHNSVTADGGGMYIFGGRVTLTGSAVTRNNSFAGAMGGPGTGGGGIIVGSNCTLDVVNSTISGNGTSGVGGGIVNSGIVNLQNATVSKNYGSLGAGGVRNTFPSATFSSRNSIIADNDTFNHANSLDFQGTLSSQGYNLIENTTGTTIAGTTTGNIIGSDPRLGALANNGGPTQTAALLAGSPAIDAADPANFPSSDQRGISRPQDGNLDGAGIPDIGAFERQLDGVFTVSKIADTNDGICSADCSLREAVAAANAVPGDILISFDPAVFNAPQTISLTMGEMRVTHSGALAVIGPGSTLLTLDGNFVGRVFSLGSASVHIAGLKITRGNGSGAIASGEGGAIYSQSPILELKDVVVKASGGSQVKGGGLRIVNSSSVLIDHSSFLENAAQDGGGIFTDDISTIITINNSILDGNRASAYGGGVWSRGGINLNNSTLSYNWANADGGGAYFPFGYGAITNSTITGNLADNGGGVHYTLTGGGIAVLNSTIAGNHAFTSGGGLVVTPNSSVSARNTIFADNGVFNTPSDFSGAIVSLGHNVIESPVGMTGAAGPDDITGVDPNLGPLVYNGGTTPTIALLPGSIAIDTADPANFPATDQRGVTRPKDGDLNGSALPDRGAFERDPNGRHTTPFDYDGDGKADFSVFRPSDGNWYLNGSVIGYVGDHFGLNGDNVTPADYDGDGKTDLSVVRPPAGGYYWKSSATGEFVYTTFGQTGDMIAPADYDGDGRAELCFFRPSTGEWRRQDSYGGPVTIIQFGAAGDKPAVGDFDGDGKADLSVFRPSAGEWRRLNSSTGQLVVVSLGAAGDKAVPADYDGDGKTDIAVFRPSTGEWIRLNSGGGSSSSTHFGANGDKPIPADFDGDGKADIAVFRPSDGNWYLLTTTSGYVGYHFGIGEDQPTPNAFVF